MSQDAQTTTKAQEPDDVVEVKSQPSTSGKKEMETQDYFGIGAIVLGVINLCSWFLPLCGCPLSIVGIILGVLGMKSKKYKTMAIIGLVLSIIGILLTIGNGLLGVYWAENPPDFMNSYSY